MAITVNWIKEIEFTKKSIHQIDYNILKVNWDINRTENENHNAEFSVKVKHQVAVIGTSSGGMNVLKNILPLLPGNFSMPIAVVQHVGPSSEKQWIDILNNACLLRVKEADEKEKLNRGSVYVAPANYHLLIERNETFSLSIDERVNYARPSIDVLFESAAFAYGSSAIGIILTGSNSDGAKGIARIGESGGLTIVQDPETAESSHMPNAAIAETRPDYILSLDKIVELLMKIDRQLKNS